MRYTSDGNNYDDTQMEWYLEKLGIRGDENGAVTKEFILSSFDSPLKVTPDSIDYGGFRLFNNRRGAVVCILVSSSQINILPEGLTVGDDIAGFDRIYRQWNPQNHAAVLFRGEYSPSNCSGIRISCSGDSNGKIREITIEQVLFKSL